MSEYKDYQTLQREATAELNEVMRYDADHENPAGKWLHPKAQDGGKFSLQKTAIDGRMGYVKFTSRVTGEGLIVEKDFHNEQFRVYREIK